MAPGLLQTIGTDDLTHGLTNGVLKSNGASPSRKMFPHDDVHFDPSLKPKSHQIKGTSPDSKILFQDVNILDSTGSEPYRGDVFIQGISHIQPCTRGRRRNVINRKINSSPNMRQGNTRQ